jgi:hypothetical protein
VYFLRATPYWLLATFCFKNNNGPEALASRPLPVMVGLDGSANL